MMDQLAHVLHLGAQLLLAGWVSLSAMHTTVPNRRDFLKSSSSGFGYLAFAALANQAALRGAASNPLAPKPGHFAAKAKRVIFLTTVLCSTLCGVAGIIYMARFGSAQPTFGVGMELNVIAAAVIGGASLWAMAGKKAEENKGVAAFFNYLSDPVVQAVNHQRTGYLPVTMEAFKITEKSGFYKQNPGTDVSVNQMIRKTTDKSRGIRLGNYVQIRTIEDEELEQVWAGKKSAKDALDSIAKRGNELLEKFEKANKS
jgi:hypothetical protein